MFITFSRVIKSGWISFFRNFWVSCATVGTLILTLFVFTGLMMINVLVDNLIENLKEKVDISVYFKQNTAESDILVIKQRLLEFPEVTRAEYISKEEALNQFKEKHKDNPLILESLEELGENPLPAVLNIKAREAGSFKNIAEFLEKGDYNIFIDKVNYRETEIIISKVFKITDAIERAGIIFNLVLGIIAVLVAFNTIRLAIYSSREEISVMRLVGASNWFIRGPFLFQGMLSGIFSALINLGIFFVITYKLSPTLNNFLPGSEIFLYYKTNIMEISLILLSIGVGLGVFSSYIAIRRYLKI